MNTGTIERPPRTLLEVFKQLPEGTLAQLIENNIVMSPSPMDRHQVVLMELSFQLYSLVQKSALGTVRIAPYDVHFDSKNVFQPDILFISNEKLHLIREDGLYGAPDLVIEILSPSTAKYDLEEKKDVYERYGVQEYWIVDPAAKSVQGYSLVGKKFEPIGKDNGVIQSRLLDTAFHF